MEEDLGSHHPGRHRAPPGAGTPRATLLVAIAVALVAFGRLLGPGPKGSPLELVLALTLVGSGMAVAVAGVRFGVRAMRAGRDVAAAPLVTGAFVVAWGLVVVVGTVGRFVGWR